MHMVVYMSKKVLRALISQQYFESVYKQEVKAKAEM